MTNLNSILKSRDITLLIDSILKSRDITLLIEVHIIKAMVFLVVITDVRDGP